MNAGCNFLVHYESTLKSPASKFVAPIPKRINRSWQTAEDAWAEIRTASDQKVYPMGYL